MKSFIHLTVLALAPLSLANWAPGKAAQLNFYADTKCTSYNGENAAWHDRWPHLGTTPHVKDSPYAECFNIGMGDSSKSINVAAVWTNNPSKATTSIGYCSLNDGFDCKGENWDHSGYKATYESCRPARSEDGYLWKSAKCYQIIV
jgi:hypothetical protein